MKKILQMFGTVVSFFRISRYRLAGLWLDNFFALRGMCEWRKSGGMRDIINPFTHSILHPFTRLKGMIPLLFIVSVSNFAFAQSFVQKTDVTVVYNNSQTNSLFQDVSRFYFSNGDLVIDQHGVENHIPVASVSRLELDAVTTNEVSSWDENTVIVYPNPASDRLYFSTAQPRDVWVTIYALSGQLLQRQHVNTNESVDVSDLAKGIYVIRIDEQTYKFTKF